MGVIMRFKIKRSFKERTLSMKKLIVSIVLVAIIVFAGNIYAEEMNITNFITKEENKDFLETFNEDEQCIILAFEHQLETFAMIYSYHHTDLISTAQSVSLWDVASLYWNSQERTLDGFLEYICKPILEKKANIELNIASFKDKLKKDYEFIKYKRFKKKEKDDFNEFIYKLFEKWMEHPQGRRTFDMLRQKLNE